MRGTEKSGSSTGRAIATTQISGAMPSSATATRPCLTRAVRATVGSPAVRGAWRYQSSARVTTRYAPATNTTEGAGVNGPSLRFPGRLDGRHPAEHGQHQRPGADAEDVHRAVQHALAPAVTAGYADEDDDGEADHPGGHPAVQQQDGEGEGRAGARAAPPAGTAERDQVADDDADQDGQRPAGGTGRKERVVPGEGPVEAGAQDEPGRRDDRRGQRGPGQLLLGLVARHVGRGSGDGGEAARAVPGRRAVLSGGAHLAARSPCRPRDPEARSELPASLQQGVPPSPHAGHPARAQP